MEELDASDLAELSFEAFEARVNALDTSVTSGEVTGLLVEHGVLSPIEKRDDEEDASALMERLERLEREGGSKGEGREEEQDDKEERKPTSPAVEADSSAKLIDEEEGPAVAEGKGGGGTAGAQPPSEATTKVDVEWSGWEALNRLLSQEGYRPVRAGDSQAVMDRVVQVLQEHRERGEMIKAYVMEKGRREGDERAAMERLEGAEKVKGRLNDSLMDAGARAKELEEELESVKRSMGEKLKEAKVKASNLSAQLRQSEHRVRVREGQVEGLLAKLEALKEREARAKEKEARVLRQLHQHTSPHKRTAESHRLIESLTALEAARQRTQEEVKSLREEVRCLNDMLKEKENYIQRRELGGAWRPRPADERKEEQGLQLLADKCRELEREARQCRVREESAVKRAEELEGQSDGLQARAERLEDENGNLLLELKSRPTVRAWRQSQKRIEELEVKLAQATQEAREAADVRELRKYMGVGELVRRDRANHRLRLDRLDDLPTELLKEVVRECCRTLEVSDISEIVPALDKMSCVLTTLPRLERFVREVCGFVRARSKGGQYDEHGQPIIIGPDQALSRLTMEEVVPTLKDWWAAIQAGKQLRSFRSRLITRLSSRLTSPVDDPSARAAVASLTADDEEVLRAVGELMQLERDVLQSRELHAGAESLLSKEPDVFLHRVVQHFQYLFQVKSVDGLYPRMNQLYLHSSEMDNFTKSLKSMLGLPASTSTTALLTALQSAIRRSRDQQQQAAWDGPLHEDEEGSRQQKKKKGGGARGGSWAQGGEDDDEPS